VHARKVMHHRSLHDISKFSNINIYQSLESHIETCLLGARLYAVLMIQCKCYCFTRGSTIQNSPADCTHQWLCSCALPSSILVLLHLRPPRKRKRSISHMHILHMTRPSFHSSYSMVYHTRLRQFMRFQACRTAPKARLSFDAT
jgi:hypothetical protein